MFVGALAAQIVALPFDSWKAERSQFVYRVTSFGEPALGTDRTYFTSVALVNDGDTAFHNVQVSLRFGGPVLRSDFSTESKGKENRLTTRRWKPDPAAPNKFLDSLDHLPRGDSYRFRITSAGPLIDTPESIIVKSDEVTGVRIWDGLGGQLSPASTATGAQSATIQEYVTEWGLFAIFVFMLLNGIISFPPSEFVMGYAGMLVVSSGGDFCSYLLSGVAGNVLGHLILYAVAKRYGMKLMNTKFWRAMIRILGAEASYERLQAWYDKYGYGAAGLLRCVPMIRSAVSVPAGVAAMKIHLYLLVTTVGDGVWIAIWLVLGMILGQSFGLYKVEVSILLVLGVATAFIFFHRAVHEQGASS